MAIRSASKLLVARSSVKKGLPVVAASFFLASSVLFFPDSVGSLGLRSVVAEAFAPVIHRDPHVGIGRSRSARLYTAAPTAFASDISPRSSSPPSSAMIDDATLENLAECAVSFAAANGLQVEASASTPPPSDEGEGARRKSHVCAPISLLPNAFPSAMFDRAQELAPPLNLLVDRISRDGEFLRQTLRDVRDVDVYTGRLLSMYEDIYLDGSEKGRFARIADRLGIHRSDYMLNGGKNGNDEYELKQVELNTIASSFAGLSATVARLHAFLAERFDDDEGAGVRNFLETNARTVIGDGYVEGDDRGVPESQALTRIPRAMALAHESYKERFLTSDGDGVAKPVVLFVVQPGETNTVDQRMLEFALWEKHRVPVVRMSLAEIHAGIRLDESTGALRILDESGAAGKREVTLVYFRAGYAPTDYPGGDDGAEWSARETLERGRAAKSPCLGYHLAGTKKVQQELARAGTVERFFTDGEGGGEDGTTASFVRTAFAGLYSLGDDANDDDLRAVAEVLGGGGGQERYVLKPQREGGGYNYYGAQLAEKLRASVSVADGDDKPVLGRDLAEFILMERLFPPQQTAILLRNGAVEGSGTTVSEFGCFGTVLVKGSDGDGNSADEGGSVVHNEYAGFLLRTKFSGVDEGGVASGFATLSSPYLC